MQKILVVEDEKKIARVVKLALEHEGYIVEIEHDGMAGYERILAESFDLILLDVMLPGMNGMEICRKVRKDSDVPIIIVSARDQTMDKVMGLDLGANDYITKPFAIPELYARIRNVMRHTVKEEKEASSHEIHGVKLNTKTYEVSFNDESVELTAKEFELLKTLMANSPMVLSRDRIVELVWGYDYLGDTNVVDVYIRHLRKKIDDKYGVKIIHTIRGVGYCVK